jgi:hypothetical protein
MLAKGVKAVQGDSETAFSANCNLKDASGGGFVAPDFFGLIAGETAF